MFTRALVRIPAANFAGGLTTVQLGAPSFPKTLHQHSAYCDALRACGLRLTVLDADADFPDSTFVEDTALITPRGAILARPGAPARLGETAAMAPVLCRLFPSLARIDSPGTLDAGDVCEAEDHFFIGLSHRTNAEGARQLAAHLAALGYTSSVIDIRHTQSILHLKSGISYIGDNTLVVIEELAGNELFRGYRQLRVPPAESYGANCVLVNGRVLTAEGHPFLVAELTAHDFHPLVLDMSEFQKMDGGLSCLSLRF